MKRFLIYANIFAWTVVLMLFASAFLGCGPSTPADVNNSIPLVGSSVDKAESHVQSAEKLIVRAAPEANTTGKALISAASDEHAGAIKELETAKEEVVTVQAERNQLVKVYDNEHAALTKITSGLWYKFGVWLWRLFWIVILLFAFHIVGGAAALFIPGPIGAGLGVAAALVNPGAWFQSLRDNYFFRKVKTNAAPPQS